jgi:hypothetical protein
VTIRRALSWLRAEASALIRGPLKGNALDARLAACRTCHRLEPAREPGQLGWCNACGCGTRTRAELTVKARMPDAQCPLDRWPREMRSGRAGSSRALLWRTEILSTTRMNT